MNKLRVLAILALFGLSTAVTPTTNTPAAAVHTITPTAASQQGKCTPEIKKLPCSSVPKPVCGNNDQSYNTACDACHDEAVASFKDGACTNNKWGCPFNLKTETDCSKYGTSPVCGSNLATYSKMCDACSTSFGLKATVNLKFVTSGACPTSNKDYNFGCTLELKNAKDCSKYATHPVCSSGKDTYSTMCDACKTPGVTYVTDGICKENGNRWGCTQAMKTAMNCDSYGKSNVCTDKGITFSKMCYACQQGATWVTSGACKDNVKKWGCYKELQTKTNCNEFIAQDVCAYNVKNKNSTTIPKMCDACRNTDVEYVVPGACPKK